MMTDEAVDYMVNKSNDHLPKTSQSGFDMAPIWRINLVVW